MVLNLKMVAYVLLVILVLPLTFLSAFQDSAGAICTNNVYVNGTTGNDGYDGSSSVYVSGSVGPKQTIQAGIDAVCEGGSVNVAAGVYSPPSTINIDKSLTLAGAGSAITVLDGAAFSSSDEVIHVNIASGGVIVISGLTVQHGANSGIFIESLHNVTVNDCAIVNNSSDVGGGIFINGEDNVSLNRCNISNNVAQSGIYGDLLGSGGGIYAFGSTLNLNACTVTNNIAMGTGDTDTGVGGGIATENTTLTMNGCTVSSNAANYGGGGLLFDGGSLFEGTYPEINSCTFSNNMAGSVGGALFFVETGPFSGALGDFSDAFKGIAHPGSFSEAIRSFDQRGSLSGSLSENQSVVRQLGNNGFSQPFPFGSVNNCNIVNNQAGDAGGGTVQLYSFLVWNGCNISGNSAWIEGGGLATFVAFDEIVNCTISGNHLTYPDPPPGLLMTGLRGISSGKTSYNHGRMDAPIINDVGGGASFEESLIFSVCNTIAGNSTSLTDEGSYGGGLFVVDTAFEVVNTIVADNRAYQTSSNNCLNYGDVYSVGHNIDGQNSCGFDDPTDQINTDPLLRPLQNNGGPTQTCAISDSSPAFDRGDNDIDFMPPTDQRGINRPQGAFCDIGAYELVLTKTATTITTIGAGDTISFTTGSGGISGLTALPVDACGTFSGSAVFPYGIFAFNIVGIAPGATVPVTITLPHPIAGIFQYWKCNGATGWVDVTSLVRYSPGDTRLILYLTDGGLGDADHLANGRIVDPGGPASVLAERPHRSSPYIAPTQQPVPLPSLAVQSAALSTSKVDSGMPVTVTAMVSNKGTVDGIMRLKLFVNSQEEATQVVTVPKGSSMQVKFTMMKDEPGTYTVYVEGITAGSFTVNDWVNPDKILFISSGLLFFALLMGIYMVWRRQRYS